MKVAQVARLLDSLLEGLDGVLGVPAAKDLKTFKEAMQPFADRNVGDFVAFLGQCEEYHRTGVVPGKKTPAGTKAAGPQARVKKVTDPQQVADAVARVRNVLTDIPHGQVDGRRIEDTLAPFMGLSTDQLGQLLGELKIAGKFKGKAAAVDKIRQVLKSQAEMYVKTHSGQ